MGKIHTIAPGIPFARALAKGVMDQYGTEPEDLPHITIFLPTNRACRVLQDAFLDLSPQKALLLPKLKALGTIDEEELSLSIAGQGGISAMLDIPPAIDPLKRQILLARLIRNIPGRTDNMAQSMQLAGALAHLMDQIHTEGLQLADLKTLVPAQFAQHWQITLDFFHILEAHWPDILAEEGAIDPAARRDKLIRALTAHWHEHPPQKPVIVAGSTGSIPATANFLHCIANLPQGHVILPGLDTAMPEEDWALIEPHHPQHGLKETLAKLGIDRADLTPWTTTHDDTGHRQAREFLAREIMRPDETTKAWIDLPASADKLAAIKTALDDLSLFEMENEQDEATLIAILLREVLEQPDKTAILITPDRNLARRVSSICKRWNIDIDDSSGQPLSKNPVGIFMQLILEAWQNNFDPVRLLALLKHTHCNPGFDPSDYTKILCEFEKQLLRTEERPSYQMLISDFKSDKNALKSRAPNAYKLLETLEPILHDPIEHGSQNKLFNIKDLIKMHLEIYDALSGHKQGITALSPLDNQAELALLSVLNQLSLQTVLFNKISLEDYADILHIIIKGQTTRTPFGGHPKLKILGQIEARTLHADRIIMAGLNEDMWPATSMIDPWMSGSMRSEFGLPDANQYISLAAHDFVQGFCNPSVIITRSNKTEGSPTIPSRWIQRFKAIMDVANIEKNTDKTNYYLNLVAALNAKTETIALPRPAPAPPVALRPTQLSVTRIETWLKDPYSIYAGYVLKLKKLPGLDDDREAASRGIIIHTVMEKLVSTHPDTLPDTALNAMMDWAQSAYQTRITDPSLWSFWAPQFRQIFSDTLNNEIEWRKLYRPLIIEDKGSISISENNQQFILTARIDRIDLHQYDPSDPAHGTAAIIDYKTGGAFTKKGLENGQFPQLPLEALILSQGGFAKTKPLQTGYLGYWYLTSNSKGGQKTEISGETIKTLIAETETKLRTLINAYNTDQMPYLSIPNPAAQPRYNDYAHLSRTQEWSANDTTEGEAA